MNTIPIVYTADWKEYNLLDSGNGEKLESFNGYTMIRPDPRAIWSHHLPQSSWDNADATFIRTDSEHGDWKIRKETPHPWTLHYHDLKFKLHPTDFKHVGVFPEQATNWNWVKKQLTINNLVHIDCYRIKNAEEISAIGAQEYFSQKNTVVVVEWADKIKKMTSLSLTEKNLPEIASRLEVLVGEKNSDVQKNENN